MATRGVKSGMLETGKRTRSRLRFRPWVRALHRDIGYFSVGLTFVYALSGLAVNHIADWEPNFRHVSRTHQLPLPLPTDDTALAEHALRALAIPAPVREVFRGSDDSLEVVLDQRSLRIDTRSGAVVEDADEPRLFLRAANWLHLNRGKKAWTYIADTYAVFLLLLSVTGLWMLPGRKGLLGRAGVIAAAGALVPALYVTLSGGP